MDLFRVLLKLQVTLVEGFRIFGLQVATQRVPPGWQGDTQSLGLDVAQY